LKIKLHIASAFTLDIPFGLILMVKFFNESFQKKATAVAVKADHGGGRAAGGIGGEPAAPRRIGERLVEAAERTFGGEQGREKGEEDHRGSRKAAPG
jgi:hypothetical protein